MRKIDAHQHFWQYSPRTHGWISDDMAVLKRDFLPDDLTPFLEANNCVGCVAVQASQTLAETNWLLSLAAQNDFILGVVGWVDLQDSQLIDTLENLTNYRKLKGVRHLIQDEPDDRFMLQTEFIRGVNHLAKYELTYDLLVFDKHLPVALSFIEQISEVPIVIDHIAKPKIGKKELQPWKQNITELAQNSSAYCKVSGMVTEANWHNWKYDNLLPYLDTVVEAFGTSRLMIGSDWPVCLLSSEYAGVIEIVERYFSSFSEEEQRQIFFQNAVDFYRLSEIKY
ncbi:MAG: amidohydrolase family protein [Tunicatimonas sp.]|uniref:amidohydrolase family protein n=1 Tax=Tunicatimonas sp. TaxID=1940096 RepID=UPI003C78CBA4